MPTIKNLHYRKFLDEGVMEEFTVDDLMAVVERVDHRFKLQAQAFLILLYWTGARPAELLEVKASQCTKTLRNIQVYVKAVKKGLPRTLVLPKKLPGMDKVIAYLGTVAPDIYLFWAFRAKYETKRINKKGDPVVSYRTSGKILYHLYEWFKVLGDRNVPPYYLRHNRFSTFAQKGATETEIRLWKGGKSLSSVTPYIHMTTTTGKKMSRMLK